MVERADISQVLSQMRTVQAQLKRPQADAIQPRGLISPQQLTQPNRTEGFGELFGKAIDQVNETQQATGRLREAYEAGTPGVSLTQVMIAAEKSSVAFTAAVQVRNKLVEAYKDVMNMPV